MIAELPAGSGLLGLGPIPGRAGTYDADLTALLRWGAGLVLTMTGAEELSFVGAESLGRDLELAGVAWLHLPMQDMGAPPADTLALWAETSRTARALLGTGGRVFSHCYGGCGRAGMVSLRRMVELGEAPEAALARLRHVRPCAVETGAQFAWAAEGAIG